MIAYQYDSETKKYIGEIDRQIDPLESQIQGKTIYLTEDIDLTGKEWKYKEIEKPEPQPEPTIEEQNEQIRLIRASLYSQLIDPLHAERQRKVVLGIWTEEMETEYMEQVKILTEQIQMENPYKIVD